MEWGMGGESVGDAVAAIPDPRHLQALLAGWDPKPPRKGGFGEGSHEDPWMG